MTPHALDDPHARGAMSPPASLHSRPINRHIATEDMPQSRLSQHQSVEPYDMIGVGFGPANLALAIALHDAIDARRPIPGLEHIRNRRPRVLFLERQTHFAWHEGMLLPGTRMQITFVKDLATLRDPRSEFTFLNYLHNKERLVQFTNLDTFLPQRIEYQDYMKWCASHFSDVVTYGSEVVDISPVAPKGGLVNSFDIRVRDVASGTTRSVCARHAIIAVGGKPNIPRALPQNDPRVLHSSRYAIHIRDVLPDPRAAYTVAIIGSGQSAAEVFNDLHTRYPNSQTRLFIRSPALKPSDDSPFVNEIFDPARVDQFYGQPVDKRARSLEQDKATNYGVVRIGLLEHIYETMYTQRIREPDQEQWQHRIVPTTTVASAEGLPNGVCLHLKNTMTAAQSCFEADAVIIAAGYKRDAHETMLQPCRDFMTKQASDGQNFQVHRDYSVGFEPGKVGDGAGIWLQGCNEDTHGLSDTLLSILATRGGEMVKSIFGDDVY